LTRKKGRGDPVARSSEGKSKVIGRKANLKKTSRKSGKKKRQISRPKGDDGKKKSCANSKHTIP